ncbi:MAG: ABC transporter permease [Geminicoccaceae bacterium]
MALPAEVVLAAGADAATVEARGDWTIVAAAGLDRSLQLLLQDQRLRDGMRATLDLAGLGRLDTAGAWLLLRTEQALRERRIAVEYEGLGEHQGFLDFVRRAEPPPMPRRPRDWLLLQLVETVGRSAFAVGRTALLLVDFLGAAMSALARLLVRPDRMRWRALVAHLEAVGLNAVGIVGLLSFLIGIVLSFQSIAQLRWYGAEIFTVNLLAIGVLRELGVLLTAIVVAGRSGSAFAAQLGTMQVGEEIDAIRVLGLDPMEVLVVPRLLALMIALPMLTFLSNLAALAGGGTLLYADLGISPSQFFTQLASAVKPTTFWLGMVKAPVFAFIIAAVGCFMGITASRSAESVGQQTTRAVVVSIFLVIVTDAVFSIVYARMGY